MRCGSTVTRRRPTPSSGRCNWVPPWPVAPHRPSRRCASYGTDVGIAFQLRDDLLGVYGDPAVTGKPAGDDLVEGKRTLLLATARAALTGQLLAELDAGIGTPGADVDRLAGIIAGSGAPDAMEQRISQLVASGLAALGGSDDAPVIGDGALARLTELARLATARRF